MKAIEMLMEEHRVIQRVLTALEIAAARLEQREEMRPAFFLNAVLFMKKYADECHHRKEEGILFKAMEEAGIAVQSGALAMMLAEHEQGREFGEAMRDAAEKWERGMLAARGTLAHNANGYVSLMRQHIYKEDRILYPLAEKELPPERQAQVEAAFAQAGAEEAEAGTQEKYPALAETLEKECTRKIAS